MQAEKAKLVQKHEGNKAKGKPFITNYYQKKGALHMCKTGESTAVT